MAARSLNRLSRGSLLKLVRLWLDDSSRCSPYLLKNRKFFEADDEDYLYTPAEDITGLCEIYANLKENVKAGTKKDIIDRIVDGDWRRGLSLHQHAMIDMAYLEQNDTALRWSALQLVPSEQEDAKLVDSGNLHDRRRGRKLNEFDSGRKYPQVSVPAFLAALRAEISPLVKAHYHLHRLPAPYDLSIIRLYISSTTTFRPSGKQIPRRAKHATDGGRVMYIALPDSCPYIYISLSGSTSSRNSKSKLTSKVDIAAMKKIVIEAIPKALSRPQQRWALQTTKLTARSLHSIAALRGSSNPGTCGGAYSEFFSTGTSSTTSPVDVQARDQSQEDEGTRLIEKRFGSMTGTHHAALDRVHVKIENAASTNEGGDTAMEDDDPLAIGLNFSGADVFFGLKKLAELGNDHLDLDKMPAWMTGELGNSSFKV
ncbi:hypothetical protein LTR84_002251 [Exophiala bonariae]|uniref:CHL4 family chromosome segregation protein n=1 Tax=Exophiala bonariae TaxID=1690606 RepID=A0AAV9NAZ1_9EURO|nr:hypothetical protein LTR84_002251 [Exophiala bonariae]